MRINVFCHALVLLSVLALGACDNPVARSVPATEAATPVATTPDDASRDLAKPVSTATGTAHVRATSDAATPATPAIATPAAAPGSSHPIEGLTPSPDTGKSCATDADCAVKDAGSCCGIRPVCVHKDTPTFPDQAKAKCAKDGRVGICGFLPITSCECLAGKCEGMTQSENGLQVQ